MAAVLNSNPSFYLRLPAFWWVLLFTVWIRSQGLVDMHQASMECMKENLPLTVSLEP